MILGNTGIVNNTRKQSKKKRKEARTHTHTIVPRKTSIVLYGVPELQALIKSKSKSGRAGKMTVGEFSGTSKT